MVDNIFKNLIDELEKSFGNLTYNNAFREVASPVPPTTTKPVTPDYQKKVEDRTSSFSKAAKSIRDEWAKKSPEWKKRAHDAMKNGLERAKNSTFNWVEEKKADKKRIAELEAETAELRRKIDALTMKTAEPVQNNIDSTDADLGELAQVLIKIRAAYEETTKADCLCKSFFKSHTYEGMPGATSMSVTTERVNGKTSSKVLYKLHDPENLLFCSVVDENSIRFYTVDLNDRTHRFINGLNEDLIKFHADVEIEFEFNSFNIKQLNEKLNIILNKPVTEKHIDWTYDIKFFTNFFKNFAAELGCNIE